MPKVTRPDDRRLARPHAKALDLRTLGSLGRLDRRTYPGRQARDLGAELIEHVGGDPTVMQRLLIERIIKMKMQLEAFDAKLEEGGWTQYDQKIYGALNNALRLSLRELEGTREGTPGVKRRRWKPQGPVLADLIAEHRETE